MQIAPFIFTVAIPACPGCCCSCILAPTLNVTLAGLTFCTTQLVVGQREFTITGWDDPNGAHEVTWPESCNSGDTVTYLGNVTVDYFIEGVYQGTITAQIQLVVRCFNGALTVWVLAALGTFAGVDVTMTFFFSDEMELDAAAATQYGTCWEEVIGIFFIGGTTGTALVELP